MIDKEHKYCIGKDDHSWEVGYDKGYYQGRADAIDECKKIVKDKCTRTCMYTDCIECMCKQFEELKEKKIE